MPSVSVVLGIVLVIVSVFSGVITGPTCVSGVVTVSVVTEGG